MASQYEANDTQDTKHLLPRCNCTDYLFKLKVNQAIARKGDLSWIRSKKVNGVTVNFLSARERNTLVYRNTLNIIEFLDKITQFSVPITKTISLNCSTIASPRLRNARARSRRAE